VYAVDDLNALVVLDAASGAPLARMATDGRTNALVNDQTDRLFLVSTDGLVQCLHEIGATEPLYHIRPTSPPTDAPTQPADDESEMPSEPSDDRRAVAPADEVGPFGGEAAEEADDMEEAPDEAPEEEAPFGVEDDENPFGFDE
jgi:N-methylhydantoinase A/oxoprolinase/acetone carboxylase beta subunit